MSEPTINDAKKLAYDHRQRAVLILSFGGGQYGGSSYGVSGPLCKDARKVLDRICDLIADGTIAIPPGLGG